MTANDSTVKTEIAVTLTKSGQEYVFILSPEDEDLARLHWNVIVGRNAHVYAHRCERGKKIYLGRSVMERVLDRPLERGETVVHLNGNLDNRREYLTLKVSKKLQAERDALNPSE